MKVKRKNSSEKKIFESNLADITSHNSKSSTYKKGVNKFTDRTPTEVRKVLGYHKGVGKYLQNAKVESRMTLKDVHTQKPATFSQDIDWRKAGIVSNVKDQGQCGSCWSFASSQSIESAWAQATGQLHVLSEQNILDCTPNPRHCGGTGGCGGGTAELAFARMVESGIASEWTYPYTSYFGKDSTCKYDPKTTVPVANVTGYVKLTTNNYDELFAAIQRGPVAISVDASSWSQYESGVFDGCNQTNPEINHAVQLVGIGTDPALGPYWLVRNSWSPSWGEDGYVRIRRTDSEQSRCGIDDHPHEGTSCDGDPPTAVVCGTCGILYDSAFPVVHKP